MFIELKHKNLDVYEIIRELVKETYKVSLLLPSEEKFNMIQQIRRAALSVELNMAEGSTRKSDVEIDAALETARDLNYFTMEELQTLGKLLNRCFAMLSKMIDL